MSYDLTNKSGRVNLIKDINDNDNKSRKAESLRQQEIYHDRLHQYVTENLEGNFDKKTVAEMSVISSINIVKRIVKEESSIYRESANREFTDLGDDQVEVLNTIYKDMKADKMFQRSNEMYKLQNQSHIQIIPKNGSYTMRVLMNHHVDVIENKEDPERDPLGFVISSFDKEEFLQNRNNDNATGIVGASTTKLSDRYDNKNIGDRGDYKSALKKYVVWTRDYEGDSGEVIPGMNFIMDDNGNIISNPEQIENPLRSYDPYMLPFINIADNRSTFEYWVRQGQSLDKFCIDYNTTLTDIQNIIRLQGYSQAVISGDVDLMPENITVGCNSILKLPIDPQNPVATNFEFVSPNPDLAGSIKFLEMLLANFLTSRGIDPKIISNSLSGGGQTFSSGYERLLSEIANFTASREDIDLFEDTEQRSFELLNAWNFVLKDTDQLKDRYKFKDFDVDSSKLIVSYHKPELMQTRNEKVERLSKEMELGFISRVDALMEIHGLEREDAVEKARIIDEEEGLLGELNVSNQGSEPDTGRGFSRD